MQSGNDEVSVNNAIVNATHHHQGVDGGDKNSNKQMSSKEINGKRPAWKTDVKLARPRSIGATPPATPRRSVGTTPPMTPRRSISGDVNDKSLALSVAVKKKTPGRVKKIRSEVSAAIVKSGELDTVTLRKVSSLSAQSSEETNEKTEDVDVKTEETVDEKKQITEEVKEFDVCQEIVVFADSKEDEQIDNGDHEEEPEEEEKEVEKKSIDVKEMNATKETSNNRVVDSEVKKYSKSPATVRKLPPSVMKKAASVHPVPPSRGTFAEKEEDFPHSQSKLKSLVDLVMWRDASRSALVFGLGTFLIVSSSYANDLNFSFISVVAYMGLIYLGVMFVFKAVIRRGVMEEEERHKGAGVREEDVRRMLRVVMPYLNESLLQLRALFSGDPSTTLKMGVVLFILARCGSSITLWNLAKFGFLGAFTVPKIFNSYSTHFSAYGKFWVRRFRDAWESCSHKKAVALALFTLVWNLSSVVARVWAAFMLFVAFRYCQQKMIWTNDQDDLEDEEHVDNDHIEEELVTEPIHKPKRAPYTMMPNKLKKIS
ncbi:hypothetical protein Bca52824_036160 [Brassica carinata]|uniref:Reticulon-like protein n=1 Tax=Brassica carinata TaxID=52824 RepID=A0A8X7S5H9_BRACI|nr:hypothetical protein Bca52824_036160 [Brassica carinata]